MYTFYTYYLVRNYSKGNFLLQKHMTSLWTIGIRPQSERSILFEYRLFECRYVTLKSYMNKDGILVSVDSKIL
jgi:hypothetical protein